MKTTKAIKGIGLVAGLLLTLAPLGAWAAGTDAGTTVTNSVSLDFDVGGVGQTTQTTSVDFAVDRKLILSVLNQDGSEVTTVPTPSATPALVALQFDVTNTSNDTVDAYLTALNSATGTASPYGAGNDGFDTGSVGIYTDNTCSTALTNSKLDDMTEGETRTVYVCSDMPGTVADGDIAVLGLVAQVGESTGSSALTGDDAATDKNANLTTVYNIFAETANTGIGADTAQFDGAAADLGAYLIQTASLSLAKTVAVLSDPTGSGTPHAIPGAIVEYTITVSNTGSTDADALDIQDTLPTTLTYTANSMTVDDGTIGATACADASGTVNLTNGSTATCDNSGNSLRVHNFTVAVGETVTITYQATIN